MQLLCRYDHETPFVLGWYDDGAPVDWTDPSHAPCTLVPFQGQIADLGKVGPEPELMGDPPTGKYPSHADMDKAGLADDHPLRPLADRPYPDRRRKAEDMRPYAAPPQSEQAVQRAYLSHVRWTKEIGGTDVDGFPAFTSRETRGQTEADASRAARDAKFGKSVKGTDGKFYDLDSKKLIAVADAVSDHVQACFDLEAKLLADINEGKLKDFGPIDEAFAKL